LEKHLLDLREVFEFPGVVQWWRLAQPHVSPDFVALVEGIFGEEAGGEDVPQN